MIQLLVLFMDVRPLCINTTQLLIKSLICAVEIGVIPVLRLQRRMEFIV